MHNHYPHPGNRGCKPADLVEVLPDMPNQVLFWTEDVYQDEAVREQMQEMVDAAEQQPRKTMASFMQEQIERQELLKKLEIENFK